MAGRTAVKKRPLAAGLDILMILLLPVLMAYSLVGEQLHEIVGSAMLVCMIVHHVLNRKWLGAATKGKYTVYRIFQTLLDFLLLILMIAQPVTGILMSKHLYTFLQVPGTSVYRELHLILAYWSFVLMSLHAGMHIPLQRVKSKGMYTFITLVWMAIAAYGCKAFIDRGFPGYLFHKTVFAFYDFSASVILFFLDYLAIMLLFMLVGYGISVLLRKQMRTKKRS